MKYHLQFNHPFQKLISVSIETQANSESFRLHLPKWRPGRYELQAYEKNVSDVEIESLDGTNVNIERKEAHIWEINAEKGSSVRISYTYYANQPDAGGSFFDEKNIYVNGINLFMYQPDQVEAPCTLQLDIPEDYLIGGGLPGEGPLYQFENFHQLVDTPFLAGKDLIHHEFSVRDIPTHLWFQGECQPDLLKMETDITSYSLAQMDIFGEFPVEDYHYLFLMLPTNFRHGVEHYNSTVITMGPGYNLMRPKMYKSWLEISSHELFHTWNVKALRPADMYPYDYDRENYSKLHYVTEGVTTYYGDLMIWKGQTWSDKQWIDSINGELRMFYGMGGKNFISLEEASYNSWVNGYKKNGAPNRRISFYTKGYLVSMLIDFEIRKATGNQYSLDNVMREMYHSVAKNNRGYTKEDYKSLIEKFSNEDFDRFFEDYVSGIKKLESALIQLGDYMGLDLMMAPPNSYTEYWWGMDKSMTDAGSAKIDNLFPNSPALQAGLSKGDEIVAIEGTKVDKNIEELLHYHRKKRSLEVHFFHLNKLKSTTITRSSDFNGLVPQFKLSANPTDEQKANFQAWQEVSINEWVGA